jgi:hypothetical protein
MKINDLVKVIRRPEACLVDVVGEYAFVETVYSGANAGYVNIQTLKADGSMGGYGGYRIDCLQLMNDDPEAQRRKKAYDDRCNEIQKENRLYNERYQAAWEKAFEEACELAELPAEVSTYQATILFEAGAKFREEWQ